MSEVAKDFNKKSFEKFVSSYRRGIPSTAFGIPFAMKTRLLGNFDGKILYIVKDFLEGEQFVKEFKGFFNYEPPLIIERQEQLLSFNASSKDLSYKRIIGLTKADNSRVLVLTLPCFLGLFTEKIKTVELKVNFDYSLDDLVKTVSLFGYKRLAMVEGKGAFSVRGDVFDIFPIDSEYPVRFEFFGDYLERIKVFEIDNGKTVEILDSFEILPATETIIEKEDIDYLVKKINNEISIYDKKENIRHKELCEDLIVRVKNQEGALLSNLLPILKNTGDVISRFQPDAVVFSEPRMLYEYAESIYKEHAERFDLLYSAGETFSFSINAINPLEKVLKLLEKVKLFSFQTLTADIKFYKPLSVLTANASSCPKYQAKFDTFTSDLKNWISNDYKVTVYAGDTERADRLFTSLAEAFVPVGKGGVKIVKDFLPSGYVDHDEKEVLVGTDDLYLKRNEKPQRAKKHTFFNAPEAGDYAVHEVHGIGKVLGSKKLTTGFGTKDYIAVAYAGGAILYVPAEQMDSLTRYVGGEKEPRLSKLGGKGFDRIKSRVKEGLKKLSFDLKKLYEERNAKRGYVFEDDEVERELFNSACGFEETPDQQTADEDIKKDMCSPKVMDRLICGDVGYGKTEVAFRAIFRAVTNGKQAVLLAPTTILAEQHYKNAVQRFKGFGVKIESLNRFKTKKQQQQVIEDLNAGKIDFVIGTHRLLSKDVSFADLGLLVLDEEQRFGVEHKEKIKLLKSNIDALTLTATPIPRTLHMSLSGIRDISTLNTPPKNRLPVETYVTELTDTLIVDALLRETARGGQAFIMYNRVETIYHFAEKLKTLLPNLKFTIAHGQMDERSLEKSMEEFYLKKSDVLIATTIIENGLDLPNANTLLVIDADYLGLSTLYQLRGRVGRSNRLAHAYFTFSRQKVLSETAYKRLSAIMEFTEMGSGFKIAMRDLEIRGAGNILGVEQHGHMDKIGYELYSKLLKEELTGKKSESDYLEMDVKVSAFIPDEYIESESGRLDAYKEIAEIENKEEADELISRFTDTYGVIPKETANLVNIAVIKRGLLGIGADALVIDRTEIVIGFSSLAKINDEKIVKAVQESSGFSFSVSAGVRIKYIRTGLTDEETLKILVQFVDRVKK